MPSLFELFWTGCLFLPLQGRLGGVFLIIPKNAVMLNLFQYLPAIPFRIPQSWQLYDNHYFSAYERTISNTTQYTSENTYSEILKKIQDDNRLEFFHTPLNPPCEGGKKARFCEPFAKLLNINVFHILKMRTIRKTD